MARKEYFFSSESVSDGNPDKICDQIVENIVDVYIEKEPKSRININCIMVDKRFMLGGVIESNANINIVEEVLKIIKSIKTNQNLNIDYPSYVIDNHIISKPLDKNPTPENVIEEEKIITGFAINDSDVFMPITLTLAHSLVIKLNKLRREKKLNLLPDAKSQVTIQYDSKGKPKRIDSIVINTQHQDNLDIKEFKEAVTEEVVKKTIPQSLFDKSTRIYVNSGGQIIDGLKGSVMGISGRKTVIDTYGSWARFGGESITGKDPYKVERCCSYMLRKIAKNFVAGGIAQRLEIQTAYAPGIAQPIILYVDSFGTGKISDDKINKKIQEVFNLNPLSIVEELELLNPIYHKTSCYGHFGRNDPSFTWEMIDKIDELK
jgi:S-adenosylmethionine synthetase